MKKFWEALTIFVAAGGGLLSIAKFQPKDEPRRPASEEASTPNPPFFSWLSNEAGQVFSASAPFHSAPVDVLTGDAKTRGQHYFLYENFGTLNTDNLRSTVAPYKALVVALFEAQKGPKRLEAKAENIPELFAQWGFLNPNAFANSNAQVPAKFWNAPVGLVKGTIKRLVPPIQLEAVNVNCAACHVGVHYEASGRPNPRLAWIGAPNPSMDLEAYGLAIYGAFQRILPEGSESLVRKIVAIFPETTLLERMTYRTFVYPSLVKAFAHLEKTIRRPLPYINGHSGLTNSIGALRERMGLIPWDRVDTEDAGFASVPDLADRGFRSTLLWDGAYSTPGVDVERETTSADHPNFLDHKLATSFFTVTAMGVSRDKVPTVWGRIGEVLQALNDYRPQKFPGRVNYAMAKTGREVFMARCSTCHGTYSEDPVDPRLVSYPNRKLSIAKIGTDPNRGTGIDPKLIEEIRKSYGQHLDLHLEGGYVAPVLTGVWQSAPYLHNGSVPTLWHLMHPKERPAEFRSGGHALDFDKVGVAYPEGYVPYAEPSVFKTSDPGHSNTGHEFPFAGLSEDAKAQLLEYLKTL